MNRQQALNWYIGLLCAGTLTVLALCAVLIWHGPSHDEAQVAQVLFLLSIGWLCSTRKVYFSESNGVMMGTIGQVATMVLLPFPLAVSTIASAKVLSEFTRSTPQTRRMRYLLVNISSSVLATAAGTSVFTVLGGTHFLWSSNVLQPLAGFPALVALGLAYYLLDAAVVSGAITLTSRERLSSIFVQITKDTFQPELSLIVVGIVFAVLWHYNPVLSLFIVVPVYLSVRSFAAVARLREETEKAVSQMAKSVDMRDTGTGVHSQQLENSATRLAKTLGLTPEHVHEIGLAARAHDLGKIELGDSILLKKGPLTPEEREIMEEHPVIGADMLASYSGFAKSAQYVRHHHERWDGRGYPDGLKGEKIPLGARIISVVDAYDAMTADRPYRKAMSVAEAVSRLKADMGTQFDPQVCAAWIQMLIEDGTFVPPETAPHLQLVTSEAS